MVLADEPRVFQRLQFAQPHTAAILDVFRRFDVRRGGFLFNKGLAVLIDVQFHVDVYLDGLGRGDAYRGQGAAAQKDGACHGGADEQDGCFSLQGQSPAGGFSFLGWRTASILREPVAPSRASFISPWSLANQKEPSPAS